MRSLDTSFSRIKDTLNYYSILGLGQTASKDEIKNAYDTLLLRHQIANAKDYNSEHTIARIALIHEAYTTLSNSEDRKKYDKKLSSALDIQRNTIGGNVLSRIYSHIKPLALYLRYSLLFITFIFLVSGIIFVAFIEIRDPETRIKGIQDGLLLLSLLSFYLLIASYFKGVPAILRSWLRVISICILLFSLILGLGLFGIPQIMKFLNLY